ncbi:MAG: type I 3-dehydroquinate dehydratase [Lachnospiraceae bacterium]|nr:type I 3-dehydroquinate dehydratase [Lachnospiraceae bacterium]
MEKKIQTIRDMRLGDGVPKICLPVTARNLAEIEAQLLKVRVFPHDMIEFRADFYDGNPVEALEFLRERMPDTPLLFTFRTKEEGGARSISSEEYVALNQRAADSRAADMIDLELNRGEILLREQCGRLQSTGIKVIASFHDFARTPDQTTLIQLLCRMQELGADITKAAVMPRTERDVLTLMSAALEMKGKYADRPYIVMSMGGLGGISRLAGSLIGSAVTFASAGASSAPGQMDAGLVSDALKALDLTKQSSYN